jgi:phosphatidylglycerophosphatase A
MSFMPTATDLAVIKKLNLKDPWVWLATWFGMGFLRPAPGTWGSLGALPFGFAIYMIGGNLLLLLAIVGLIYFGWHAAGEFAKQTGTDDHSMIVVDEVAGQWIALLGTAMNPLMVALSFLLFRFFDVTKIWPVNWCEKKLPGAAGVMTDDIAAGIYALICLLGIQYAGLG